MSRDDGDTLKWGPPPKDTGTLTVSPAFARLYRAAVALRDETNDSWCHYSPTQERHAYAIRYATISEFRAALAECGEVGE